MVTINIAVRLIAARKGYATESCNLMSENLRFITICHRDLCVSVTQPLAPSHMTSIEGAEITENEEKTFNRTVLNSLLLS